MNVAVMRTKAEAALTESFEAVAGRLPGKRAVAEARRAAIGVFAAKGLPHRRIEEWKYTDLRSALKEANPPAVRDASGASTAEIDAALGPLAAIDADRVVFVNGAYRPELSAVAASRTLEIKPLGAALEESPDKIGERLAAIGAPADATLALNTAFMTDGAVIRIAEKARLARPLLLVFARAGTEACSVTTRNAISVGAGAEATIIEAYVRLAGAAKGQSNALTDISVGDGAVVDHLKCTTTAGETHLCAWVSSLAAEAVYRAFQFTRSPALARNQIFVTFQGEGAKLDLSGAFLARESEHVDTTLLVDHAVPRCESRELFKGVLDGRARGVFQGKIIVRPDAQKSDGKQMAQALMLSQDAEFDSKPELEIYADDVVCGHGSTVAEIDPDLVFYCQSRGIPAATARALLTESFVAEAMAKVEDEPVRTALMTLAQDWLSGAD